MPNPFADLPEPELVDVRDETVARPALERFGEAVWEEALHYLYTCLLYTSDAADE